VACPSHLALATVKQPNFPRNWATEDSWGGGGVRRREGLKTAAYKVWGIHSGVLTRGGLLLGSTNCDSEGGFSGNQGGIGADGVVLLITMDMNIQLKLRYGNKMRTRKSQPLKYGCIKRGGGEKDSALAVGSANEVFLTKSQARGRRRRAGA